MDHKNLQKIIEIVKSRHEVKDYKYHILPVVNNALLLAERLKADQEIVEVAAYLHDIGRAGKGKDDDGHDIDGEVEARKILISLKIDPDKIEKVCHCILTHRKKDGRIPGTIEAEIIVNADAMSHFDGFLWLWAIYYEQGSIEIAYEELAEKIQKDWDKKLSLPIAKDIIRPKYEAVNLLLENINLYISEQKAK